MIKHYKNLNQIITLADAYKKDGRNLLPEDLSIIKNASIVFDSEKIIWSGNSSEIPAEYSNIDTTDLDGYILTPELVDSHTHLTFGGDRSFEYTLRLNGADYEEIAKSGGGILSTMAETIKLSEDELFKVSCERIDRIHSYGIGAIEIKSGYGLTYQSEMKLSKVIHKLKQHYKDKVTILNTYMAAHAVPDTYKDSGEYIEKLVIPLLEELNKDGIIDFVDIFHEKGYFDFSDTKRLFDFAKSLGLKTKIHADEFNDNKGAILACVYDSVSADHLLTTAEDGIKALAQSNTVATLLPGTAFFLGKPLAPARKFLDAGCKVAIASDYNPGSCHCDNLLLIASLAAKSMNFNICELWTAISMNAAHALDLQDQGAIIPGLRPRFSIFKCSSIDQITYSWGRNFSEKV